MALVIVQLQDAPDGSVEVRLANEPHIASDRSTFTPAEKLGAVIVNTLHRAMSRQQDGLLISDGGELPN